MTKSESIEERDNSDAIAPTADVMDNASVSSNDQVEQDSSSAPTTEKHASDINNDKSVVDASPKKRGDSVTAITNDDKNSASIDDNETEQPMKSSTTESIDNENTKKDAAVNESKIESASTSSTKVSSDKISNKDDPKWEKDNTIVSAKTNIKNAPKTKEDFDSDQYSDKNDTLLTMSFNQDGGCLAVGTASGFRICNVHPYQETFRRNLGFKTSSNNGTGAGGGSGGIARIEMLYRTNLLALTGHHSTASHSQYPPNKVLIYDDHSQRTIGELSFRQKILVTKLRRDRIVVVLRDRVYVYNFSDLSLLDKVHTGDNPDGLIGLSLDNWGVGGGGGAEKASDVLGARNGMVLACPSTQRGQVRVELYGLRRTTFVDAHESALGALALSVDGSLLATASERGTVVRLFDTRGVTVGGGRVSSASSTTSVSSSIPLKEFRRGFERATISCLTFSLDSNWLASASDHGTVHIFQAQDPNSRKDSSVSNNSTRSKSRSSSMTGKAMRMLPKLVSSPKKFLMDGEHSYAQVRGVPNPRACAFVPDKERTIAVAGTDDYDNGVLLLAEFGNRPSSITGTTAAAKAGRGLDGSVEDTEAKRIGYHRFFKKGGAASMHGRSNRRSIKSSRDGKFNENIVEGGAYIDDNASVNLRMNHIRIGDENEDDFVPIDYDMEK